MSENAYSDKTTEELQEIVDMIQQILEETDDEQTDNEMEEHVELQLEPNLQTANLPESHTSKPSETSTQPIQTQRRLETQITHPSHQLEDTNLHPIPPDHSLGIARANWRKGQQEDPYLQKYYQYLLFGEIPTQEKREKFLKKAALFYFDRERLLCRKFVDDRKREYQQICVPMNKRNFVLATHHDTPMALTWDVIKPTKRFYLILNR